MSVQENDQRSDPRVIWSSTWTGNAERDRSETELDESVVGVVAGLVVTGVSGGLWGDDQYPVCDGCDGWLPDVDTDASMSGVKDAPVPCGCCTSKSWDQSQWAAFRLRMDLVVAAWTEFYGPTDEALVAKRQAWIRARYAFYAERLAG